MAQTWSERMSERFQDAYLGSPEENAHFREWLAQQAPDEDLEALLEKHEPEMWEKWRDSGAWTDLFLDFAYDLLEKQEGKQ